MSLGLVDRFLVNMDQQEVKTSICITKKDMTEKEKLNRVKDIYEAAGYKVFMISNKTGEGISEVKEFLTGVTTVLSGPSGVGKSSLIKQLLPDSNVEVGDISKKIGRGKNTTRHTEILQLDEESFVYDTPGYSSINLLPKEEGEIELYMPEFKQFLGKCKFTGCSHISEPQCSVRQAVSDGIISVERYESYKEMFNSIKAGRKW